MSNICNTMDISVAHLHPCQLDSRGKFLAGEMTRGWPSSCKIVIDGQMFKKMTKHFFCSYVINLGDNELKHFMFIKNMKKIIYFWKKFIICLYAYDDECYCIFKVVPFVPPMVGWNLSISTSSLPPSKSIGQFGDDPTVSHNKQVIHNDKKRKKSPFSDKDS